MAKKPLYLLAGGNWSNPGTMTPLLESIFAETGKPQPRLAYIGTANGDDAFYYHALSKMVTSAGASADRVCLAKNNADVAAAKKVLQAADVVFISGGDVEEGMRWLNKHDLVNFLRNLYAEGKLFFGISAGSIMLGTHWVRWLNPKDDTTAELFACLGLARVLCDTHAEKDGWDELQVAVPLLGRNRKGYGIPTGGMLRITPSGKVEALVHPATVYQAKDGRAIELAALLPRGSNNFHYPG
jgi:peptidase E